jgi:predicted nucleotidyltransferase component of viral defense system
MSTNLKTASEFRKQLESHLRIHSMKTGQHIHRLRRKVAFDRLLARIFTEKPSSFFLKGGYGMELRAAQARATKDIDLSCFKRISTSKEPMAELILQELQTLARIKLNDHFVYQIGPPQSDIENAPYGGSRHSVLTLINNTPFVEFHLDMGVDFLIDHVEKIPGTNWLEFCGIEAPIIPMISVEQQFAEKLHSYTLPRERINTRSKDLIDLVLLLNFNNRTPEAFEYSLHRVFRARNTHSLPEVLAKPPMSWQDPFTAMALECGISPDLKEGFAKVSDFYNTLQEISKRKTMEQKTVKIPSLQI